MFLWTMSAEKAQILARMANIERLIVDGCYTRKALSGGGSFQFSQYPHSPPLNPQDLQVLLQLQTSRTKNEHVRHFKTKLGWSGENLRFAVKSLDRFLQNGWLLRQSDLIRSLRCSQKPSPAKPIQNLAILTQDAPEFLEKSALRLISDAITRTHNLSLLVIDDSRNPHSSQLNRKVLGCLKRKYGIEIQILNRSGRQTLCNRLVELTGVSKSLVQFALFGAADAGSPYGAARNSAMLCLAGKKFISLDDDVDCRLRRPRQTRISDFVLSGRPTSLEVGLISDLQRATRDSFYQCHNDRLGYSAPEIFRFQHPASVTFFQGQAFPKLFSTESRVIATSMGHYGAPGFDLEGLPLLLGGSDDPQGSSYNGMTSRGLWRGSRKLSLTPAGPIAGGNLGIDNRNPTVPFFPNFRNEDGFWGAHLNAEIPGALLLHFPFAVGHMTRPNRLTAPTPVKPSLSFLDFLQLLALNHSLSSSDKSFTPSRSFSQELVRLSTVSEKKYRELVGLYHRDLCQQRVIYANELLSKLQKGSRPSKKLSHDLQSLARQNALALKLNIDSFSNRISGNQFLRFKESQKLLRQFAGLIEVWPRLFGVSQDVGGACAIEA